MEVAGNDNYEAAQPPRRQWLTPVRLNLLIIALLIAVLNAGILFLCYIAITGEEVSEFVVGALLGLLPTGITGLVSLGTTLLNENREN